MPAGKKIAIAFATLMAGLCLALAFRKSDPGAETEPSGRRLAGQLTRRLAIAPNDPPPSPFRLAPHPDTGFQPPPAATGGGLAEIARAPNGYEGDSSPIGALLQPLNLEPPLSAPANLAPGPDLRGPGETAEPESIERHHRIADGDTLSKLAAEYLGSGERYLEIFALNRDVLKSPDLLPVGKSLKIPAASKQQPPSAITAPTTSAPGAAASTVLAPLDGWRPAK